MFNKMQGARMVLANGDPITELRHGKGESLALSSATGEFNASDKRDLALQIDRLLNAVQSGAVVPEQQVATASSREERTALMRDAMASKENWEALGANIAQQVYEQADRDGFLRKLSVGNTLRTGEVQRVPMPPHDTQAVVATGPAGVGYQNIRQRVFLPAEFEIIANVRVNALDMEQVSGDLLEHAYNDALQSIMVQEDRLWKRAADATVGMMNPLEYIAGELTTKNLGRLRTAVTDWNLPATTAIISNEFWSDIIGSNDFATMLDPITKYDLALNGQLGTLVGLTLLTDGFRQPNQKVLEKGEIYVVASPENHASYSTRGGIRSTPVDYAFEGSTAKGWMLSEMFSFVLANNRSVVKGKRLVR